MPKFILDEDGQLRIPESALRSNTSPGASEWWLHPQADSITLLPRMPDLRKIYVEPTTVCNIKCRTCLRNIWGDPVAHMEMAIFEAFMHQLGDFPRLKEVVFLGLGETLTHPKILEMVKMVRARDLKVTIGSNGLLLTQPIIQGVVDLGVDRLIISLDGATPETFADIRGAALSKVLDNLRALNIAKQKSDSLKPALEIEFVAMKSNVNELEAMAKLASELNASKVIVSNVLAYTDDMGPEILYGYEPRKPLRSGSWAVRAGAWVMWGTLDLPRMHWGAEPACRFVNDKALVVGWDGKVAPCLALSHNYSYLTIDGVRKRVQRYNLGDITQTSLLEIWTSRDYCQFRHEVRGFHFPSCPDCNIRDSCDLRKANEGCWGWSPSCADCLWAQDIIRCP